MKLEGSPGRWFDGIDRDSVYVLVTKRNTNPPNKGPGNAEELPIRLLYCAATSLSWPTELRHDVPARRRSVLQPHVRIRTTVSFDDLVFNFGARLVSYWKFQNDGVDEKGVASTTLQGWARAQCANDRAAGYRRRRRAVRWHGYGVVRRRRGMDRYYIAGAAV